MNTNRSPLLHQATMLALLSGVGMASFSASAEIVHHGTTSEISTRDTESQASVDYAHALPLDLPAIAPRSALEIQSDMIRALSAADDSAVPGFSRGARGDGKRHPVRLPKAESPAFDGIAPQEFGTTNHPFSTARNDSPTTTNTSYPARASGKLFFNIGASTYVCSASLIKRGLVVTAAHCVADFGQNRYYTNWRFVPGYRNGVAPYGTWSAASARVMTSYLNGSDPCAAAGVVCRNDVATLTLTTQNGAYPGTNTGWYGYGYNGYGFTAGKTAQVTQIGYPVCLDSGNYQERNDSYAYVSNANSYNSVIGSLMCGGSSGGPWLVNYGIRPTLNGTTAGTWADANLVIGVTSWGYTSSSPKEMGASPFTSDNIKALVDAACAATPSACQ